MIGGCRPLHACRRCGGRGCLTAEHVTKRGNSVFRVADACPACTRAAEQQWRLGQELAELGVPIAGNRKAVA